MRSSGCFVSACGALLLMQVGLACSGGSPSQPIAARPTANPPAPAGPRWIPVDLPGEYSEMRSAAYDKARNAVWVMSREFGPNGSEILTLTRISASDRTSASILTIPVVDYDAGLIALDSRDIVWMAWGETLMRFDPDTDAARSWTRPAYSGLTRLYSGDGRMSAMTIDSTGEIWVAASMVTAVFGFDPRKESWDRPINLPIAPGDLAAPAPGIITVNGTALAGGALDPNYSPRFAVITTATRSVKTLSIPVGAYISVGGGRILYLGAAGTLIQYDLIRGTSTVIATGPVDGARPRMAVDQDGNVWMEWIPPVAQGSPGLARLNPSSGAISQFPFPIAIRYYEPRPSPSSCFGHGCLPVECKPVEMFRCIPTPVSLMPDIEGMAPDTNGNVWLVTASSSNPDPNSLYAPVVELQTGAD